MEICSTVRFSFVFRNFCGRRGEGRRGTAGRLGPGRTLAAAAATIEKKGFDLELGLGFDLRFDLGFDLGFDRGFNLGFDLGLDLGFDLGLDLGFVHNWRHADAYVP